MIRFSREPDSKKCAPANGFTLVEILVALAIFAVISVLAYRATAALTDGEQRLSAEAAHWRAVEQLFTRLEADIRQAVPRPLAEGGRTLPPWQGRREASERVQLQFARAAPSLPTAVGTAHGQRLAYVWEKNGGNGGALALWFWPAFDNPPGSEPQRYLLLDGIAFFRLEYLTRKGDWVEDWPRLDEAPLPRALRVQLAAADGAVIEKIIALQ